MIFYLMSNILRQFELINIDLPIINNPCCNRTSLYLLHWWLLFFIIDLFKFLKNLLVELVLDEFSTNKSIRLNIFVVFYSNINTLYLQWFFIEGCLFTYLLLIQGISFYKDGIDSEEYFPKNTLNQCGNDINNGNVHETEEKHDECIVVRCTPTVVKGELRPSCLSQHHDHYVLWMNETCKVRELLILIVGRKASSIIEIIEEFHTNNTVYVEEEEEEGHEPYNDWQNFEQNRVNVD